jgi:hypothetical protein
MEDKIAVKLLENTEFQTGEEGEILLLFLKHFNIADANRYNAYIN